MKLEKQKRISEELAFLLEERKYKLCRKLIELMYDEMLFDGFLIAAISAKITEEGFAEAYRKRDLLEDRYVDMICDPQYCDLLIAFMYGSIDIDDAIVSGWGRGHDFYSAIHFTGTKGQEYNGEYLKIAKKVHGFLTNRGDGND